MFADENHNFSRLCACYEYANLLRDEMRERFDREQVNEAFRMTNDYLRTLLPVASDNLPDDVYDDANRLIADTLRNSYFYLVVKDKHEITTKRLRDLLRYLRENGIKAIALAYGERFPSLLTAAINENWHATNTTYRSEMLVEHADRNYDGVVITYAGEE